MNTAVAAVVTTAVPIMLLIAVGRLIAWLGLLTQDGIRSLTSLIVQVALPAVLFRAFLEIEFDQRYLGLFALMWAILGGLLAVGYLFARFSPAPQPAPFLMTGFEFGMLGIGLFGTVYGTAAIGTISIVGLPHELFIWFVFVSLMEARFRGRTDLRSILGSFVRSPVIIAMVTGILLNGLGAAPLLTGSLVGASVLGALDLLAGIVAPLVLIIIGAGLKLSARGVRDALPIVGVRMVLLGAIVTLVLPLVIVRWLRLPPIFLAASATFVLLPPPFIVPLWLPKDAEADAAYTNSVLTLHTILSIAAFLVLVAFLPPR